MGPKSRASARYLERVVTGDERGAGSWVIRALLWPLSAVYALGLTVYLGLYRVGIRRRHRLPALVISVGNLTFGGTGKTPVVQSLCRILTSAGCSVVVLSRGHGGTAKGCLLVSDGESVLCDSRQSGDEPMLLARTLPGVPVIVGKDRRRTGELACEKFSPDVIVLDDGLQYWQLHRDMDIVILNTAKPFGSGFVMPMGDLREPPGALRRAGIVLLGNSRAVEPGELARLRKRVRALSPGAGCFPCRHVPVCLHRVSTGEKVEVNWLRRRTVAAFCGIGRPAAFIDMLESLGAYVARSVVYPDHHAYTDSDLAAVAAEARACGAEAIITTAKDLARLGNNPALSDLYTLEIEMEIGDGSDFADCINKWVDGKS